MKYEGKGPNRASIETHIFHIPDTMFYTNQFVPDIKEIVSNKFVLNDDWTASYFKTFDVAL